MSSQVQPDHAPAEAQKPASTPPESNMTCGLRHTLPAMREVGLRLPKASVTCALPSGHSGAHEGYRGSTGFCWRVPVGAP